MLNENIKKFRMSRGLSQEELAVKLNVVRQTVSKWENGLSVPDADLLVRLADELNTKVSVLLGEDVVGLDQYHDLAVIAEKLEVVNRQLINRENRRKKVLHAVFAVLFSIGCIAFVYAAVSSGRIIFMSSFPTNSSVGIIGGADGPTSIIVTRKFSPDIFGFLLTVLLLIVSAVGLHKTKQR